METCCTTEECVNKSNECLRAAFECHQDVAVRASEGWKLKWTDPGPEIKVIHSIVPGPFAGPKILKALPYQLVSKCGSCVARNRPRLRNGIPDPWLEYLNYDAWKEDQEFVKRCIKITDYVWQKKGLSLLQGIPDPWKSDIPCACEIKKGAKKKKISQNKEFTRRRSSASERESPSRRSSTNEKKTPRRRSSTHGTPRRKSRNEEESLSRSESVNGEYPPGHQNANHEEKSPSRRSSINEESPRRRSSNRCAENTKRRIKNTEIHNKELIRRRSKSVGKAVRCAMCYAVEPSETAYVCYGGIVPACLRDYFEECPMRRSKGHEEKSRRHRSKRCDEEPVRRSRRKCDEEVPTKRRHKNCDVILKDCLKSCEKLVECKKKCRQDRRSKSRSKYRTKESTGRLSCATSEDSSELSVEALKKSRKRCNATKHKVEQEKAPPRSMKKLRACSGFEKVKQRLQELENDLKAREAAKELKLREMEQLSKLRKKACKERKYRVCKQFCKQKGNDWSDDEAMDKIRCNWKEPVSSRANCCLKYIECSTLTDRSKNKEVKESTPCNNKVSAFNLRLDEPSALKKESSKESTKSPKKTEAPKVASHVVRDSKPPQAPIKSICKKTKPVTAKVHSPTKSKVNPPCSANPRRVLYNEEAQPSTRTSSPCSPSQRRVSYDDEPQPSSRTCSPCSPSHRRVSYDDEPQPSSRTCSPCSPRQRRVSYSDEPQPLMTRTSSPCFRKCHQGSNDQKPFTSRCNSSKKSPRCMSIPRSASTISPKESKESMEKFLEELDSRIEITQDALNSPCMKSVAVQPFQEEATKIWRCPGREFCPRMRERAGGDEDSELFVRRVRVSEAVDRDVQVVAKLEETFKFNKTYVENDKDSVASDCNAGASRTYQQRSYRAGALADFERRQKEIEEMELFVESFSERDC